MTTLPQPVTTPLVYEVREKTTPKYTATITDDNGNALPAASLTTLTLTLYRIDATGATQIINSRNAQNVLNANNVTIDANGLLTWAVQILDTTLGDATLPFERHIALWTWTWQAGAKTGRHEVILNIQNLVLVS